MNPKVKSFIDDSEEVLIGEQGTLKDNLKEIISFFEKEVLTKLEINDVLFHGRVKKPKSLREKIIRKNYHTEGNTPQEFMKKLPDIIGIRLICLLKDQENDIYNQLSSIFDHTVGEFSFIKGITSNALGINFTKKQPEKQQNGKDIFRIECQWVDPSGNQTRVELQIKSLVHMFWGEIEHMLFYKNYSYVVGVEFYKKVIESTYSMLESIDSQLKIMKEQMFSDTDNIRIKQLKQMVTKFLYSTFNDEFIKDHGCKIDLREAYELLVQIIFNKHDSINDVTTLSKDIFAKLTEEIIIETPQVLLPTNHKILAKRLNELYQEDEFWLAFFIMYYNLHDKAEVNLNSMARMLVSPYLTIFENAQYPDSFGFKLLKRSMLDGVISAFIEYSKMDFFLLNIHSTKIIDILNDYLILFEPYVMDWEEDSYTSNDYQNQEKIIVLIIKVVILSKIKNKLVKKEFLDELQALLINPDLITTFTLDQDGLNDAINKFDVLKNDNYVQLFSSKGGDSDDK